jgi:U11/U12 small nuclear ribonucleoprotein 20 kDa protein
MPLGKYYCDYCEKQFQDTPAARKRHVQGAQHQRARAAWYDAIRHQGQAGPSPSSTRRLSLFRVSSNTTSSATALA